MKLNRRTTSKCQRRVDKQRAIDHFDANLTITITADGASLIGPT